MFCEATELARRIRAREISAREIMEACLAQQERTNPTVNAIVNRIGRDVALGLADRADSAVARGDEIGPLHGLPIAVKDLVEVEGFPTTYGFRPFAENIAQEDSLLAARLRKAGALIIGKTNTPEFGLGSHTFNALFGITRNPYNPAKSAGGSSGGAAAALACGMLPIADGSDMGGSLRNPASFCNVVGFRPSIGRVPSDRAFGWLGRLSTAGPMGRTVRDAAMLLSVLAGPDARDPLSLETPGSVFGESLERDVAALRIAWTTDLGAFPVQGEVAGLVEAAAHTFESLGCVVREDHPNLDGAMEVFQVQRAANLAEFENRLARMIPNWRDFAKDTAVWNIDKALNLTAKEILEAETLRTEIYRRVVAFFEGHDFLILPAAQVVAFDVETEWVEEINGQKMETYIDWMSVCCAISITGLPAISVPCGFSDEGLPVGLQIVGGRNKDFEVLQIAHAFEKATQHHRKHPSIAL